MRALIQRVTEASVSIEGLSERSIGKGIVVLLGITGTDSEKEVTWLIEKILTLRIFPSDDRTSEFDRSVEDVGGEILVVSQFTLYGNVRKGRRPDFSDAAGTADARKLYDRFVELLTQRFPRVTTGEFQATMLVKIHNQGPVTLLLDTPTP
ncbi:MAG TPA: D-aminoacyl-tRNA deacylase [Elusimicrobiota bacterium]|nr:D-aminoacyl-tRNA deacylase [Elusimicrobiota bacterium]